MHLLCMKCWEETNSLLLSIVTCNFRTMHDQYRFYDSETWAWQTCCQTYFFPFLLLRWILFLKLNANVGIKWVCDWKAWWYIDIYARSLGTTLLCTRSKTRDKNAKTAVTTWTPRGVYLFEVGVQRGSTVLFVVWVACIFNSQGILRW